MKKYLILTGIVACLSVFTEATINSKEISSEDIRIVNFCNLTKDDLTEVMQGLHPDKVIEFLPNTVLPINYYLKGNWINSVQSEEKGGAVEITQTFYARCTDKELLFSSDLSEWKPLLEFITGEVFIGLNVQDTQTSLVIKAEANRM